MIVIMIDSSEKRNCEGGFRVRMSVKSAVKTVHNCPELNSGFFQEKIFSFGR